MSSEELKYLFKLPIGDWSGDGHSMCEYIKIRTNKTIEEVREGHFDLIKQFPKFDVLFSEYEQ